MVSLSGVVRILGTASLISFTLSCHPPTQEITSEGPPPVSRVVYRGSQVVVYPEVHWQELVDETLFEGLRPGIEFDEATRILGEPEREGSGLWGPYKQYRREGGIVEVSFEKRSSGLTGAVFSSWWLTAFPENGDVRNLLSPVLLRRVHLDMTDRTELTVMAPDGSHPVLSMVLREGEVELITWLSE